MKKALTATTALVAAGVVSAGPAAAQIELRLDGYMNNFFGFGDIDNDDPDVDRNPTNLFSDGEVWFVGEYTADNGITFGANIQLEAFGLGDDNSTPVGRDHVDENFAYIEGSFGRINVGSENSAAYLMQYSAPEAGAPINSGWVTAFIPPDGQVAAFRHPAVSTFLDYGNDENGISYFTPRFAGFQLGVTYTPTISGDGDGSNSPADTDCDGAANSCDGRNGVSVGLNFVESFNGFDVAVAGGFRTATEAFTPAGAVSVKSETDQLYQYSAGLNLGFGGFTVGGSFALEDSDQTTEGHSWDAGISYSTGPITVAATYFQSESEGSEAVSGEDELMAAKVAINYTLAPGIIT
ncbi:MAG: porin, partial [Rhodospirillales bacterium]|nr:porin [Rhodospirillales bacterium]